MATQLRQKARNPSTLHREWKKKQIRNTPQHGPVTDIVLSRFFPPRRPIRGGVWKKHAGRSAMKGARWKKHAERTLAEAYRNEHAGRTTKEGHQSGSVLVVTHRPYDKLCRNHTVCLHVGGPFVGGFVSTGLIDSCPCEFFPGKRVSRLTSDY